MKKDNNYNKLIETGRKLVQQNGVNFLTARKLSDASGCSIGAIYNQFSNMDNFVLIQNIITLDELYQKLISTPRTNNAYKNLNAYLDSFVDYVLSNKNLWYLLFKFHLEANNNLPSIYLKKLAIVTKLWQKDFNHVFIKMTTKEKKLSSQVMWLSLFSLSSFLTTQSLDGLNRVNRKTVSKLLLNTYLAGLRSLNTKR